MHTVSPFSQSSVLILESGEIFTGRLIGDPGTTTGEAVFNTSLSGYQEILTDPSYAGQIITFTTPEIGNYGMRPHENESPHIHARGLIVKHLNPYSGYNPDVEHLHSCLSRHHITGISGIDTRKLTRILRTRGLCRALISTEKIPYAELLSRLRQTELYDEQNFVQTVSSPTPYMFLSATQCQDIPNESLGAKTFPDRPTTDTKSTSHDRGKGIPPTKNNGLRIIAIDYGIKRNILRLLKTMASHVLVLPYRTAAEKILELEPDGILLSNGPGNPEILTTAIENIRKLIGKRPLFGICLGHQLLALARHEKTYKLQFGHRGGNHPIRYTARSKIEITAQNHGFAIVKRDDQEQHLSHFNQNDQTIAGIEDKEKNCFSVQYHPEGAPGPHDSRYLFDHFIHAAFSFQQQCHVAVT